MSDAAIGALTVRQQEVQRSWKPARTYDYALAAVSWETRSTSGIPVLAKAAAKLVLVRFDSSSDDVNAAKDKNQGAITSAIAPAELIRLGKSVEAAGNCSKLEEWLRDKYVEAGRPLRILVDITCFPKSYLLFLLGLSFTRDFVACFDCVYAAGKFDLAKAAEAIPNQIGGPRALVSEGDWRSHQIPYLEANEFLPDERDLIVALGGELGLSLPFIERFEPRRLELLFIQETAPGDNTPMLQSERAALDELNREPNARRTDISLGDVISVAQHALMLSMTAGEAGVTGLAIGSKTHALGLGLAALAARNMEIVCRTPTAYKPIDVQPSGKQYFFQIEDRFEPCSYL